MASSPSTTLVSDEKPPLGLKQGLKEDARAPYGRPKALVRLFLFVTYFLTSCFVYVPCCHLLCRFVRDDWKLTGW